MGLPGISKIANIRHSILNIKGVNNGGKRGVDVKLAGELDVHFGGEQIDFDYTMEVKPRAGKSALITIAGVEVPGKTIKVPMLSGFTLSDVSFGMDNSFGHWRWWTYANSKIRTTKARVLYNNNNGSRNFVILSKVTLADVIDTPGLPGLDDVEMDSVEINSARIVTKGKVKNVTVSLNIFKQPGASGHFIAMNLGVKGKPVSMFIPGTGSTPLKDVKFESLSFVYSPAKTTTKIIEGRLYRPAWLDVSAFTKDLTVKPGLNMFGHLDIDPSGEMGKLLRKVGVKEIRLPLGGGFSPKAFSKNLSGAAIKNALLDALDLDIKIPKLQVPEVDKFLTFNNGRLKIKGKTPAGKRGIDVAISGDADVHVKGDRVAFFVDVEYDKAGGASELSFKGHTDKKWTHPLGIDFLDLDSLSLSIDKKKQASGGSSFDIKMAAKTDIGSHSRLDVTVDVDEKNGHVTDAFFELDGPLKLSEIPGIKDIPSASHFEIDTIKASEHGVEAKTDFGGKKDLDVYLFTGSGWNLIVRQDNFTMTEFVPPLKNTPLKHVVLSEAAIVLSKDGLQGALSGFSTIAQDALKDIYGAGASNIDVDSGLSLIAAFEHKKSKGGMADAFSRLGLKQERLILTGGIGGLFGGPTKLDVQVALSAHTGAKNQPKWMKSKPGVEAVFSMIATETAGQFDIEFGIGVDITAKVHGTELVFDAKVALEFEDEKIDVKIVADLKDKKGWRHPFGIPGFTLNEVGLDLGLDEDGAIHLGFDGSITVSGDKYSIAADADLLPEALGAPQDIAFIGSADKVDMFFVEEIAIAMIGGHFKLDIPGGILPTFTNVKFAFVTPGAQDPDLHITGEGFALSGGMSWLDHELGSMSVSVGPKKGIYASGKIDDINLGPLHLKNNDFSMDIGLKSVPSLKLDSDIEFIGIKEKFHIAFDKTGVSMDANVRFGPDFGMTSDLKLSGIDLSVKKPEFKHADFYMKGDFQLDIGKFIAGPARKSLDDVFNGLDAAFKDAEKAIKKAQKKVDGLTTKINAERAKVRRKKAAAEARVQSAENRVNSLNGTLNYKWGRYHGCHGWGKWPCRARWGISIGWTEAEVRVADAALNFVKSLISHFPVDLDPAVAALIAARDTAKGALYVAEKAIEGADDLDSFMKKAVDKLTKDLKNSINIHKAGFSGDLRGIIEHDTPVDLTLDAEFFGATVNDTFAFKIKDIAYDVDIWA